MNRIKELRNAIVNKKRVTDEELPVLSHVNLAECESAGQGFNRLQRLGSEHQK